jgi:hypothetical protein
MKLGPWVATLSCGDFRRRCSVRSSVSWVNLFRAAALGGARGRPWESFYTGQCCRT